MADIHFDNTLGNDSTGDGSIGTPYKTLAKLKTVVAVSDTAKLKKGEVWDEILRLDSTPASEGQRITITGYGSGDNPLIQRSELSSFTASVLPDQTLVGTTDYAIGAFAAGSTTITFTSAVLTTGTLGHLNHSLNFQQGLFTGYVIDSVVSTTECTVTGDATGEAETTGDSLLLTTYQTSTNKTLLAATTEAFAAGDVNDVILFETANRSGGISSFIDTQHILVNLDMSGLSVSEACSIWETAANGSGTGMQLNNRDYLTLDGIDIDSCIGCGVGNGNEVIIRNCNLSNIHGGSAGSVLSLGEFGSTTTNVLVEDCTFDNITAAATGCINCSGNAGQHVSDITIRGCTITNCNSNGMLFSYCDNIVLENNVLGPALFGIGGGHQDGIEIFGGDNVTIRNNIVHSFTQLLYLPSAGVDVNMTNVFIYGNVLYNWKYWTLTGATSPAIQIGLTSTSDITFSGCQIFANTIGYQGDQTGLGIVINKGSANPTMDDITIVNNSFYEVSGPDFTGTSAYILPAGITNLLVDYNNYFNCAKSSETEANSLLASDPLFVDYTGKGATTFNVRLQPGSPCDDAGDPSLTSNVTVPASFLDIDGVTRVKDGGDIGAFELVSGGVAGPLQVAILVG